MNTAIRHEKRLKRWRHAWKIALIEAGNPHWRDLAPPPA
jgi:putative endonuclease